MFTKKRRFSNVAIHNFIGNFKEHVYKKHRRLMFLEYLFIGNFRSNERFPLEHSEAGSIV